jgi:3-oxoacyl-[acyl-carrier protein] reductase
MGLLEGKTALITGAARGIGKAIALKFAEEGANIAFTDLEVNEETEKEIAAKGVKAKSYASNAADFAQTEDVVKAVKEEDTKPQVAKVVYGALGKLQRK